jgi:hypothetical protein
MKLFYLHRKQSGWSVKLTTHHHLTPRLRMAGAISPRNSYAFMGGMVTVSFQFIHFQLSHNFFLIFLSLYLLTPWSRVLLEKLTGSEASQEILRILWNPKVLKFLISFMSLYFILHHKYHSHYTKATPTTHPHLRTYNAPNFPARQFFLDYLTLKMKAL